ncbi:hypothetical protein EVAR_57227_1 [Eumeta japonica]|uniref:Gustatory receptor n=1 Tax=Eumeta variegata TaxID=151549 RepID=A0A4C1YLG9_EUMVA|nr:hypothetical protein EVAR_57227_1 [Eumeta japonica]
MTGVKFAIQNTIPKKLDQDTVVEENHSAYLCRTLKRTEDAYDDLCSCCSILNEVFGFSLTVTKRSFGVERNPQQIGKLMVADANVVSGLLNSLLIWISFYALVVVAAACESVHRSARDLHRHLALFNSEIYRDDKSSEVRELSRDVLHAVRARHPRLTACGLFDLRMNLITGYLSLIATYSIVLLQFTNFFE